MKLEIPSFWRKKSFLSYVLLPLSWVYLIILFIRKFYIKPYTSKAKIITVGNVTVGGAGKTPIVLSLSKIIKNRYNKKFAILTKGYKGSVIGPAIVNNQQNIAQIGDEALLLSREFITCVSKDRLAGIKFLESQGYDLIITDDGLHDNRFKKNLTFMVIDSLFGFGNEYVCPAGPLRESIHSASLKSDLIILVGKHDFEFKSHNQKPLLKAALEPKLILNKERYIAFAGIGNPIKFFESVEDAEGIILEKIAFADHYQYTEKDMKYLLSLKQKYQAKLITTEKDFVRISSNYREYIDVLPVSIIWEKEDQLISKLENL